MPLAEELGERAVALPEGLDTLRREARIAAQAAWHLVIGDEQIDRTVGRGLQYEFALEFECGAEQRRERHRLAKELRHRLRVVVPRQDGVDDRSKLDQAADHVGLIGLEWQDQIVGRNDELDPLLRCRFRRHHLAPTRSARRPLAAPRATDPEDPAEEGLARDVSRHQARMAFCTCSRFSASSHTTDCGPSITAAVISSPRWAGRQCMKMAPGEAAFISFSSTWKRRNCSVRSKASASPIETQVSVTMQSAPFTASCGLSEILTLPPCACAQ